MTWKITDTTVTLVCNGDRHMDPRYGLGVQPAFTTTIGEDETAVDATQRIWQIAAVDRHSDVWKASSTQHHCGACVSASAPGNPTAE